MIQRSNATKPSVFSVSLTLRMLLGAGIGLLLISIFLIGAGDGKPEWGPLWMIRPLVVVPIAGAMGGLFYHIMDHMTYYGGWKKVLAIIFSVLVYFVALWLGTVLGLDGTLWD